jgi:hypothetical protein
LRDFREGFEEERKGKGSKEGAFPKGDWAHFPRKFSVYKWLKFIAVREAILYGSVQSVQQGRGHVFQGRLWARKLRLFGVLLAVEGAVQFCPYSFCLAHFSRCYPTKEGRTIVWIWHRFLVRKEWDCWVL